jgi:hypothetical protein
VGVHRSEVETLEQAGGPAAGFSQEGRNRESRRREVRRAQELAQSGAQEDDGQKRDNLFNFTGIGQGPESGQPRRSERAALRSPGHAYVRRQEMWRGRPDVVETTLVEPGVGMSLACLASLVSLYAPVPRA